MNHAHFSRRQLIQAGAATLGVASLGSLMAQPSAATTAALAALTGAERQKRLAEGAKKEGVVSIYTSMPQDDMAALTTAFEAKYGVKAKVWRSGSEKILQRGLLEAKASRFEVDVFETNSPEMEVLSREKVLIAGNSPFLNELIPQAIPAHKEWIATRLNIFTCAYNTKLVKKEELPKTYQDLLDPKWKGKLSVEADDSDWLAETVMKMGEEKGIALFKEIARKNAVSVRKGHTLLSNLVASGEVPMALTVYNYKIEQMKNSGAPVDWFALDPTIARPNANGVARNAPHPHAALLFQDFELTEGQVILGKRDFIPTSTKVPSTLNKMPLTFANPKTTLDDGQKWNKLYDDIFNRKA
ncbi:MAG: extracellular solute-binding protein [Betaproteobacteria bacterium]|jgi:iron(III) transport system substrate-binding protein|nr:extracellular solute-binding protein [Betaproteobacteria bacterium]